MYLFSHDSESQKSKIRRLTGPCCFQRIQGTRVPAFPSFWGPPVLLGSGPFLGLLPLLPLSRPPPLTLMP